MQKKILSLFIIFLFITQAAYSVARDYFQLSMYAPLSEQAFFYLENRQLDSIIFKQDNEEFKEIFDYNHSGEINVYSFRRDTLNNWNKFFKTKLTYYENDTIITSFHWNIDKNDWDAGEKNGIYRDNKGNITHIIELNWDSKTEQFKRVGGVEYMYDKDGNQTLRVPYSWRYTIDRPESFKLEHFFDDKHNEIYAISYQWLTHNPFRPYYSLVNGQKISTIGWVMLVKRETTYNQHNKPTTKIRMPNEWCPSEDRWRNDICAIKEEYFYDENQNPTLIVHYCRDATTGNHWEKTGIVYEYCYDEYENLTAKSGNWGGGQRYYREYAYDRNHQKILELIRLSKEDQWINYSKEEYRYDERGNKEMEIHYSWDDEKEEWISRRKEESRYDEKGNIEMKIYYSWDFGKREWRGYKEEYKYDKRGNQLLSENSRIESGNDWKKESKLEKVYDENNNLLLSIEMRGKENTWVNSSKTEYEYIHTNLVKRKSDYKWDTETQQWEKDVEVEYFYGIK